MTFPENAFVLESVNYNDGYVDVEFTDKGDNAIRRLWRVTFDAQDRSWYGNLMRSETDDGSFDVGIYLPKKMVHGLAKLCAYNIWKKLEETKHED